jgi:hypothetical protein
MTGIQFGLDGKPDKYQMPGKAEMALAIMSFFQALDPPDWNYTTVQPPSALSLPATGDAVVDTFVNDYLTAISYKAAALHAHERWQAATIAGDAASATLQLNAFNTYSGLAEDAEAVLPQDNATLASYLPAVNVNSYPGGANAIAARVNAQCGQPLPAAVNTELLKFMDQATIDDKVCEVASSVRPSDINTNIGALLRAIP